jgi:hypothetical protein
MALSSSIPVPPRAIADARDAADQARRDEANVQAEVGAERARRTLPLLDRVTIATPCPARWEDMTGTDQARFCGQCSKTVYNVSAMTREEAETLLGQAELPCVRIYQRADGTILTSDCPVGLVRKRRRTLLASIAATVVAGLSGLGFIAARRAMQPQVLMGAVEPEYHATAGIPFIAPEATPTMPVPSALPSATTGKPPHAQAPRPQHPGRNK